MLFIHFFVDELILFQVDFDFGLDLDLDQVGSLNIDEAEDFGLVVDAPKNELERVSVDFDEDPNGHQEDDLDS